MFTGLVEAVGSVAFRRGSRLGVAAALGGVKRGDSLAVDGVCLTAVAAGRGRRRVLEFDVSEETFRRSSLGGLAPGRRVNLERAARLGAPLGGHFVLGHVDAVGKLKSRTARGASQELEFSFPAAFAKYLVFKGSVAVDGVSLTAARVSGSSFAAAVIPHTARHTTLGAKKAGEAVNLEFDILAKHVEKLLKRRS
ncbi:MAG: riboflavin synthase [Elusimicrobiota bacterium]